jgi:hypothetical protein
MYNMMSLDFCQCNSSFGYIFSLTCISTPNSVSVIGSNRSSITGPRIITKDLGKSNMRRVDRISSLKGDASP